MFEKVIRLENSSWKFIYGDHPEAAVPEFDDQDWYDIGIPHSFGTPYFQANEFYTGYGCYRKWLDISEDWMGKKITLEFQGAFQVTEVYVNGKSAGSHEGGYTAFVIDITDYVKPGKNLLFIRVNNLWSARIAPRAGEHVFNGGIYRDVTLCAAEKLHIAWYGITVLTPEVSSDRAEVIVKTEICNESENKEICSLKADITAPDGEHLKTLVTENIVLEAGESRVVDLGLVIEKPQLWHPDTPDCYSVSCAVEQNGCIKDHQETVFGCRWFRFDGKEGFFLNGEHYLIHGANVHQDHAGWSDAVTHDGIRRDVQMIKDCGMNFIRGSHYPHHTFFAEECDRQGILFWSENCFWGTGGPDIEGFWTASAYPVNKEDEEAFEQSCLQTLSEMIRANRNHPSIIVWSMCNEPFFTAPETVDKAKNLLRKLVERTHELDPSRPAAVGGVQRGGFDVIGDLAGYNGDGAVLFIDPGFPNLVSEYGSVVEDRPGRFDPRYTDGTDNDYAWRSGKSLWCGFHHGSIFSDMGHMGMIDYYRLPLNTWYWYRQENLGIPAPESVKEGKAEKILLEADRTVVSCDGTQAVFITAALTDRKGIRVSASDSVKLTVRKGYGVFPTGNSFEFSAENGNFADGLGAVEMRAYFAGEIIVEAKSESGLCCEMKLMAEGDEREGGTPLKMQESVPSVTGLPYTEDPYEIGKDRPVFCSSAMSGHQGGCVCDGSSETFWKAGNEDDGEWVMVDLEGNRNIRYVTVWLKDPIDTEAELAFSADRISFTELKSFTAAAEDGSIEAEAQIKARYIRVRFRNKPSAVGKIEILA